MLSHFKHITKDDLFRYTNAREGEQKLGQTISALQKNESVLEFLQTTKSKFVIIGIPEDIGIRANMGRSGARKMWQNFLSIFCNIQHNTFLNGEDLCVLGYVDCDDLEEKSHYLDVHEPNELEKLRAIVSEIDDRVSDITRSIVAQNKIPIVIGGGHNNAYGLIKGLSEFLMKAVNAINLDPHSDLRPMEGRHSGNSFSYAMNLDYLDKYAILGLHESYNSQATLDRIHRHPKNIQYISFESIFIRQENTWNDAISELCSFVDNNACGLEIDMDSIAFAPVSAMTPSGISPEQARRYVYESARILKPSYFHLCELAPDLGSEHPLLSGKLLSYLIADFIKGYKS